MRKLEERPGTRLNKPDMRGSGAISRLSTKYIGTSQVPVFWEFSSSIPQTCAVCSYAGPGRAGLSDSTWANAVSVANSIDCVEQPSPELLNQRLVSLAVIALPC